MSLLGLPAHVKLATVTWFWRHFKSKNSLWDGHTLAWATTLQPLSLPALYGPQLMELSMGWRCIFLGHGPQLLQLSSPVLWAQEQNHDQWSTHSWYCNHSWPLRPVTLPQCLHREKISSLETPHLYAWSQPTCSASTSLPPCIINEQYQSPVFSQLICSHSHDSKYHTSNSSSYFNGS